jgi:hypothetical protein
MHYEIEHIFILRNSKVVHKIVRNHNKFERKNLNYLVHQFLSEMQIWAMPD